MTNDCSDGALPDPDSSNNPEINCVLPLHNEFDFAGLEGLEGLKVNNIEPQKIAWLPRWTRSDRSRFQTHKNDIYIVPKELDEKVAELHFPALHSPHSGTSRLHRRQG